MEMRALSQHGGRLSVARKAYPNAPEPWIDLSTGINPHPFPAPRASAAERSRLPQIDEITELERRAAIAFGAEEECVIAAPGTEVILRLLPRLWPIHVAFVLAPTYSSHADAWEGSGARVRMISHEHLSAACDEPRSALVIVNPNNPDGRILAPALLRSLHDALARCDGVLIVDEAFVEVTPGASVARLAGKTCSRMIVLRSFGKFYGLAGLRLGFVIAAAEIAFRLRQLWGDWPISADAIAAGAAAYADPTWAEHARARLTRASERLDRLLTRAGFDVAGGTALYRLARARDAQARFRALLNAGILTRPFGYDPSLLRLGLPKTASDWRRLAAALES